VLRIKSFVLAEGLVALFLVSAIVIWQSEVLTNLNNELDQAKTQYFAQRQQTLEAFKLWQKNQDSR
jgi:hypothetical protein